MRNISAEINYAKWQLAIYEELQTKYKTYLETCDDSVERAVLDSLDIIKEYIESLNERIASLNYEAESYKPIPAYWQEQIDDILNLYNFEKIESILNYCALDGYIEPEEIPSVDELKSTANELMRNIVKEFESLKQHKSNYAIRGSLKGFTSEILPQKNSENFYITLHYQVN